MVNKPVISRERVISAALATIDAHGLGGFKLEIVARSIGVRAPSLYYHFRDKSELFGEVVLSLLQKVDIPDDIAADAWEAALIDICVQTRRQILFHYRAAPLLLEFAPRSIFLEAYEKWVRQCPYPVAVHMLLVEGIEKLTFGSAVFAAGERMRTESAAAADHRRDYPHLNRALRASPWDDEQMFVETIRTFVAGLAGRAGVPDSIAAKGKPGALREGVGARSSPTGGRRDPDPPHNA